MGKLLVATNGARVVNVSSDGYRLSPIRSADYDFHVCPYKIVISQLKILILTAIGRGILQEIESLRTGEDGKPSDSHFSCGEARQEGLVGLQPSSGYH